MERQHSYKQALQAQPGNIREAHVINPPQVEGAGHGILKAAAALGGEFMNIVARDYNREMRGRMDDSILRVNVEFEKWKTNYKATRQGVDALTAQKDFADKYMELANQAVIDFDGNKNEIYAGELQRELAKNGLYALKEGGAYQLQQDEAWQASQWQAQLSSFKNIIDNNPNDPDMLNLEAHTLLQSWIAKNPGKDSGAVRDEIQSMLANGRMNAYLARAQGGDDAALQAAKALLDSRKVGFALASEESGADKHLAIGYDPNGGTSYGMWQLSSKQGSMSEWLNLLAESGEKGAAIAKEIRAAGPLNTGSRKGAAVEAYKRLARENPELFAQTQHEYLLKTHYGPALSSLNPKQRVMIEQNGALQEMLFSTAVQHGGGGAASIFKNAWRDGMTDEDMVRAVYAGRGNPGNFKSTPEDMAGNILGKRFPREQAKVLSMLRGGVPGLTSVQAAVARTKLDAIIKHNQQEKLKNGINEFLTQTQAMPVVERMKLAEERFGKDPAMQEQYRAAIGGIQADERMHEAIRKVQEKQQEQQLYNQLQVCSELPDKARGWLEARTLIEQLPLEQRGKFYTAFGNLRKHESVSDPVAVEEVTERLANGEEFNIRAEYGGRLSNQMIEKFNKEGFRKALPEIKNAFKDAAFEWLGDAANKNNAKEFGFTTPGSLLTHFLNSTDADEKMDSTRLRKEADDFFKKVVLERGWFRRNVNTIRGLQGLALDRYDDARPSDGSQEWQAAIDYLKYRYPDRKKFTDDEIANAYRALTGNPRKEKI